MYPVLIILAIIVSILLVFVVLIQNSKGGGLAANFAAGNQVFGVRQTADTLEKATWYLSITLGLLCILATVFPPTTRNQTGTSTSTVQQYSNEFQNREAQPGFGMEQTTTEDEGQAPAGEQVQQPEEQTQTTETEE